MVGQMQSCQPLDRAETHLACKHNHIQTQFSIPQKKPQVSIFGNKIIFFFLNADNIADGANELLAL